MGTLPSRYLRTPPPLSFVRSGYVNLNGGVGSVGSYGFNWSRTATSSAYAYYMYFTPGGIIPSSGYDRYRGNPLRCLYVV